MSGLRVSIFSIFWALIEIIMVPYREIQTDIYLMFNKNNQRVAIE